MQESVLKKRRRNLEARADRQKQINKQNRVCFCQNIHSIISCISDLHILWTGANMRHIRCRSCYYCQYHIHKRCQTRQGDLSLYCFGWAPIPVYKSISDRFLRLEPKMKSTMIFYQIREIDGLDFGVVLPLNIVQYKYNWLNRLVKISTPPILVAIM